MIESYPLQWPHGKPRCQYPVRSRFDVSFGLARDHLLKEIALLGGQFPIISSNIKTRRDGLPLANQPQPADMGIAVYFSLKNVQMCFCCDKWDRTSDNIQAIRHTIAALRGIERWGGGKMMEEAFTGFIALPAPKSPEEILGVHKGASHNETDAAYRAMAKIYHPDKEGGSQERMAEINAARSRLLS